MKESKTKKAILELLKLKGRCSQATLVEELGVTKMAISRHLKDLAKEKLVTYHEKKVDIGRPVMYWELTSEADKFFPNGHAELTTSLLSTMQKALGKVALEKVIEARSEEQYQSYSKQLSKVITLEKKIKILSEIRTEEGYIAEYERVSKDKILFIENHCPICFAAQFCAGLCEGELSVFIRLFEPNYSVERTDHIIGGQKRCVYLIKKNTSI